MHTKIEDQMDYSEGENGMKVHRYSMFLPLNPKELFADYPELRKYDEFKSLDPADVTFCWFMAHASSPISHWEKEDQKVIFAVKRSYIGKISTNKYNDLVGQNFSEKMKNAMEKMSSFRPGTRARILKILETTLLNWESIANVKIDLEALAKGDNIKDIRDYITTTKEIYKQIPELLEQAEQGFSIVLNDDADDESDYIGLLDDWHDENALGIPT